MAEKNESTIFEHYELIPRQQTFRHLNPDHLIVLNSKPITYAQIVGQGENSNKKSQIQTLQKSLVAKQQVISKMAVEIESLNKVIRQKDRQYAQLIKLFQQSKQIMKDKSLNQSSFLSALSNLKKQSQIKVPNQTHQININAKLQSLQSVLLQKQSQIRSLKSQLLESTANNINALFNSQINQKQMVLKQIDITRQQIIRANNQPSKLSCAHEDKLIKLIKNYQQMLALYHKNESNVNELKAKQQEYFAYFSSMKVEMNQSIQKVCSLQMGQRLTDLQKKMTNLNDGFNSLPEKAKPDQQSDFRVRQLVNQIQNLNQKIVQREIQVQKLRQKNNQLMAKNRQLQAYALQLEQIEKLEVKLKSKQKRIQQLQNTIIDHIDSRAKEQSNTSNDSDMQKNKNIIRNLKVIVANLKTDNQNLQAKLKQVSNEKTELKRKLSNLCGQSYQQMDSGQKVTKDEGSFKVVQDIVEVLLSEAQHSGQCKCLQKTTDCLMLLNEEYPELQGILEDLGIIQKTSNLIPVAIESS